MSHLRADALARHRRETLTKIPQNFALRIVALDLRRRLVDVLEAVGGAHYQIGKYYPYREALTGARSLESRLQELLDKEEIRELVQR